jgi:hypothetical protein
MRMFIGVIGATALLLWSLACWGTVWLLSGSADFVAAQVGQWSVWEPELEPAVATVNAALDRFGSGLAWALWAVGALLLAVSTWLSVQVASWLLRLAERSRGWVGSLMSARAATGSNREPTQIPHAG